jgi:hypothetical protein
MMQKPQEVMTSWNCIIVPDVVRKWIQRPLQHMVVVALPVMSSSPLLGS